MLDLTVDAYPPQMELDTGASVSIISEKTWKRSLVNLNLRHLESSWQHTPVKGHRFWGSGLLGRRDGSFP